MDRRARRLAVLLAALGLAAVLSGGVWVTRHWPFGRSVPEEPQDVATTAAPAPAAVAVDDTVLTLADAAITPAELAGGWFAKHIERWQTPSPATQQRVVRIPLALVGPEAPLSVNLPVSGGVPFAMGQLQPEAAVTLFDDGGAIWPVQSRALATWGDGSVKWLLVSTRVPVNARGRRLFLEYGPGLGAGDAMDPRVIVEPSAERVTVTTGPLRFSVSATHGMLLDSAFVDTNRNGRFEDAERLGGGADLAVKQSNQEFRSSLDRDTYQLTVEESGPLRATLKATGWYRNSAGKPFCRFVVRLQAFAGLPQIRVYHTFIYTGFPGLAGHDDARGVDAVRGISLDLPVVMTAGGSLVTADDRTVYDAPLAGRTAIMQQAANAYQIRKGTTVVHDGARNEGWMLVQDNSGGVLVSVRDAWQQYPKELVADPFNGRLSVKLWPESSGEMSLGPDAGASPGTPGAVGLAKTHELVLGFLGVEVPAETARALANLWNEPWHLTADPAWIQATQALPIGPRQPSGDAETMLEDLFGWMERQPRDFGWYGVLNYGDTRPWYRKQNAAKSDSPWGWHPEVWQNNAGPGAHTAALLGYARTQDRRYLRFAEAKARHVMDVDTVHDDTVAKDPKLATLVGETPSPIGSVHAPAARHWGGRHEDASGCRLDGLLLYYYLTGYDRAWDVALTIGDFLKTDPIASRKALHDVSAASIAAALSGGALLYEATWDRAYRQAADRQAALALSGQLADGLWPEAYDGRNRRWTAGGDILSTDQLLSAFIAYHRVTGNSRVGEAIRRGANALIEHQAIIPGLAAIAYSHRLSGEKRFLDAGQQRIARLIAGQQRSDDPVRHGMVMDQLSYDRAAAVLAGVPALLAAADAPDYQAMQREVSSLPAAPGQPSRRPYEVLIVPSTRKVLPGQPLAGAKNPARLSMARNEAESVQLVLTSAHGLRGVNVIPQELRQESGAVIPRHAIRWAPVGFVETQEPGYEVSHIGLWPDPLGEARPFDVKPGLPQPIWLTVTTDATTPPGEYRGAVTIQPSDAPAHEVELIVRVWNFTLPPRPTLKTAFDVYPNRIRSAYEQFFPQWSSQWESQTDAVRRIEQRFHESLIGHRLAPVLNVDLADPEASRYLRRLWDLGLSAFAVGRHGGSFDNNWPEDGSALETLRSDYRQYANQLRQLGLLGRHYIYLYDEPPVGLPRVADIAAMLHRADPELRTLVTVQSTPDAGKHGAWLEDIDVLCIRNLEFEPEAAKRLADAGKELWIYVSGPKPPYPTLVIDYPALAYRVLPWMCWKYGVSGLLYWSVNYWTTNPYEKPMNTPWQQNGNGSLYYPGMDGPVPSIRLEILRDGLEDYEYLALLDQVVANVRATTGTQSPELAALLAEADAALAVDPAVASSMRVYTRDPEVLRAARERIATLIEELSSRR